MEPDAEPDAELIARLRRSGIRIDREGQFIHEGESVRHEGLRQALFRWLDRLDDGRYVLRLDARRFAYLDVDDTPLVVRSLRVGPGDRVGLVLSDGAEEALDPATLTIDDEGILRCWVRGGRLEARLSTSAAAALAERIIETDRGPALAPASGGAPSLLPGRRGA
jgi:hypothetical protein